MNILITGSSGSIGSSFSKDQVSILNFRMDADSHAMAEQVQAKSKSPTCLIHLAAMTSVDQCELEPELCRQVNVEGAVKVFKAAELCKVERFIFVSTAHVYSASDSHSVDITHPVGPRNNYAKSKLEAERELECLASVSGTKLSVARIFSLKGEGLKPGFLYPALVERAKRADYSPIKGFSNVRDFLSLTEVKQELVRLAQSHSFPARVNICSGRPTTVGQLAAEIYQKQGLDPSQLRGEPGRPGDQSYLVGVPTKFH